MKKIQIISDKNLNEKIRLNIKKILLKNKLNRKNLVIVIGGDVLCFKL